jgi:WD40 repeat protein/energy-coupling factor transporter ATP-binding protein EcfA2
LGGDLIERLCIVQNLPHLIFLCSCSSANYCGGLAQGIIQTLATPTVVAMTDSVTIKTATELAHDFYPRLLKSGEVDVALQQAAAPLAERHDITIPGLFSSRINPVLFGIQEDIIGKKSDALQIFVAASRLADGRIKLTPPQPKKTTEPYKFLSYYETTDTDIFFGRTAISEHLVAQIVSHKLVLINGKSGSGKTSIINAGIIPRLIERGYFILVFREYDRYPTEDIKKSLAELNINLVNSNTLLQCIRSTIKRTRKPVAIFFDQFERFFLKISHENRKEFVGELKECLESVCTIPVVKQNGISQERKDNWDKINIQDINLVISLREDFFGRLGEFWKDIPDFNTESYSEYLEPLNEIEAREAIAKPLGQMEWKVGYEPEFLTHCLVPNLLQGSEGESNKQIEPVHLQIVCNRLFKEVRKCYIEQLEAGEIVMIKQKLYEDLGGVEGILQGYLQEMLNEKFSVRQQQDELKTILKQMVTSQGTREFRMVIEIAENLSIKKEKVEEIIQQLDRSRLIETISGEDSSQNKYSITHEFLAKQINQWYTLKELELKRATEIYERCLENWNDPKNRSCIPRNQFLFLQKYKTALLKWKPEGKLLFQRSKLLYYGRDILIGSVFVAFMGFTVGLLLTLQQSKLNEVRASLQASEASFISSNKELDALLAALRAGKILRQEQIFKFLFFKPETQLMEQATNALQQALYNIRERNRLETKTDNLLPISDVSVSPNGELIATASYDQTVKLWNSNGKLLKILNEHEDELGCVTFNSDGQQLASAGKDKTILWDSDGKLIRTFPAHHDGEIFYGLPCVAFNPRRDILATTGYDKTVKLWNLDGSLRTVISDHEDGVWGINFSPDGEMLVSASRDGTIRFWNVDDGKNLGVAVPNPDSDVKTHVRSAILSKDGKILVTSADNGEVTIWQVIHKNNSVSLTFLKKIKAFQDWALGASLSVDGKLVASVSSEGEIMFWKIKENLFEIIPGHLGSAVSVTFSSDGKTLITGGSDGLVKLWNTEGYFRNGFGSQSNAHYKIKFYPNINILASATWESELEEWTVKRWRLDGSLLKPALTGYTNRINDLSFSPNGQMLATAAWGGTVKVWDLKSIISQNISEGKHFFTVSFSPDGNFLAHDYGRKIMLWKIKEGKIDKTSSRLIPENSYAHEDVIHKVAFSPDSSIIASASPERTIKLWSIEGNLLMTFTGHNHWITGLSFSSNGKLLASSSNDGTVKIWDISEGKLLHTLVGHDGAIEAVEFSPNGHLIASVGEDKTLRIWKADGQLVQTLQGHTEAIYGVSFSQDSKFVASASWDGNIKIWSPEILEFDELLERGCKWLNDYLKTNLYVNPAQRKLCDRTPSLTFKNKY